jgi:hypothetical protein
LAVIESWSEGVFTEADRKDAIVMLEGVFMTTYDPIKMRVTFDALATLSWTRRRLFDSLRRFLLEFKYTTWTVADIVGGNEEKLFNRARYLDIRLTDRTSRIEQYTISEEPRVLMYRYAEGKPTLPYPMLMLDPTKKTGSQAPQSTPEVQPTNEDVRRIIADAMSKAKFGEAAGEKSERSSGEKSERSSGKTSNGGEVRHDP